VRWGVCIDRKRLKAKKTKVGINKNTKIAILRVQERILRVARARGKKKNDQKTLNKPNMLSAKKQKGKRSLVEAPPPPFRPPFSEMPY
jgi:hypothetical protein